MKTAIVILNYNDTETTLSCLKAIGGYRAYDHVIVVDNASTDPSTAEVRALCGRMGADFVQAAKNRGYAAGNNVGIRYAIERYDAEIVFVSNPDVRCAEEDVCAIVKAFSDHERVGVATGLVHVYDRDHALKAYSAFAYRTPRTSDMLLNCFLITTKIRRMRGKSMYYDPAQVKENGYVYAEAVSGCFFAISREAFLAVDGLDEDTFLYYEESILGCRLKAAGYRGLVLDVPVIHDEKSDKAAGWKRQRRTHRWMQKSARVYMKKYLHCGRAAAAAYAVFSGIGFLERYLISLAARQSASGAITT